jgi:hypothetical protein
VWKLRIPDAHRVVSRFPRWSYFENSCLSNPPEELVIERDGFTIHFRHVAGERPRLYFDISPDPSRYQISGDRLLQPPTEGPPMFLRTYGTIYGILPDAVSDMRIRFEVRDRISGKVSSFAYDFAVDECLCKGYDGP